MAKIKLLLILGLLALGIGLVGCGSDPDVIGKVGNLKITVAEFRQLAADKYNTSDLSHLSFEDKMKVMDILINKRVRAAEAIKMGLDKDPQFIKEKKERLDRLVAQFLFKQRVIEQLISEDLLKQVYDWNNSRVKTITVVIGYKGLRNYKGTREKEQALELAQTVKEELQTSENPSKVAMKYSDHPLVSENRGFWNPFPRGQYGLEVDQAVFSAQNDQVVGPFDTSIGFLVVKVIEKRHLNPQKTFQDEKEFLKQDVYRSYFALQGKELYEQETEKLKSNFQAQINQENIEKFFNTMREWGKKVGKLDSDFDEEQRSLVLAKIGDREITVGSFIDQFQGKFHINYQRYNSITLLNRVIESQINYFAWVLEGYREGLQNNPDIKGEISTFAANYLSSRLESELVRGKVQVSEEEIQAYYDTHKSEFTEPRKIRVWEIAVKDAQLANDIARKARGGANFEKLAETYTEKRPMRQRKGDLGFLSENARLGDIVEKSFQAGPNQIVGPFRFGAYYYVLKTGELKPAQLKDVSEVRGLIEGRIKNEKENQLRDQLVQELRKKYMYRINESLLRRVT